MSDFLRDPDLDRLVDQLNSDPAAAEGPNAAADLASVLEPEPLLGGASEARIVTVVDDGEPLSCLLGDMARRGAAPRTSSSSPICRRSSASTAGSAPPPDRRSPKRTSG